MAQQHLEQVLTGAGLGADQVKALVDLPADATEFKPEEYVTPLHATLETKVMNDPKFYEKLTPEVLATQAPKLLKDVEGAQYGRAAAIVRQNVLKAAGLTEKEFADLGDEGKKIDVFTQAFVKKMADGKITDKELQTKLMEANTVIEEMKGKEPEIEKRHSDRAEATINERTFDLVVLSTLATVPGLKVSPTLVAAKAIADLKGQFAYEVNGLNVALRQKDNPKLKVLVDNNTKELDLTRALTDWAKANGAIDPKQATTKDNGASKVDVVTGPEGLVVSSHVNDKLAKRAKEDEKLPTGPAK